MSGRPSGYRTSPLPRRERTDGRPPLFVLPFFPEQRNLQGTTGNRLEKKRRALHRHKDRRVCSVDESRNRHLCPTTSSCDVFPNHGSTRGDDHRRPSGKCHVEKRGASGRRGSVDGRRRGRTPDTCVRTESFLES